jgi:hypothetical protein
MKYALVILTATPDFDEMNFSVRRVDDQNVIATAKFTCDNELKQFSLIVEFVRDEDYETGKLFLAIHQAFVKSEFSSLSWEEDAFEFECDE